MPQRPNAFRRIIQWVTRRRISLSEEEEHRLEERRLLEEEDLEQRRLEQRIRELRPPRRPGWPEGRRRVRILYTNRWTESQQDLAQLASEGRHETHRPGEPVVYRVQLLERAEAVENVRRGLTLNIRENGVTFRFDLLQMNDGEITWLVQIFPQE